MRKRAPGVDSLAGSLSDLARTDPTVAERMIQLTAIPGSKQRRIIIAKVIAWLNSTTALLAGLNLIDDDLTPGFLTRFIAPLKMSSLRNVPTAATHSPTLWHAEARTTSRRVSSRWRSAIHGVPRASTCCWPRSKNGALNTAGRLPSRVIRILTPEKCGLRLIRAPRRTLRVANQSPAPYWSSTVSLRQVGFIRACVGGVRLLPATEINGMSPWMFVLNVAETIRF